MKLRCGNFYFLVLVLKNLNIYSVLQCEWVCVHKCALVSSSLLCPPICLEQSLPLNAGSHFLGCAASQQEAAISFSHLLLQACLTGVCHMSSCYTAVGSTFRSSSLWCKRSYPLSHLSAPDILSARLSRVRFVCKQHSAPMIVDRVSAFLALYSSS